MLGIKYPGQLESRFQMYIRFSCDKDKPDFCTEQVEKPGIGEMRKILDGIIVVAIFVEVPIQQRPDIKSAAETDAHVHNVRMAQGEIYSVKGAEATSGDRKFQARIMGVDEREDFLDDVLLIADMFEHAGLRWDLLVEP